MTTASKSAAAEGKETLNLQARASGFALSTSGKVSLQKEPPVAEEKIALLRGHRLGALLSR